MSTSLNLTALSLYHAPISSCSARIRIALLLKKPSIPSTLPITYHDVSLTAGVQLSPAYKALNPNSSVPALVVEYQSQEGSGEPKKFVITQSLAILEFLETQFPQPKLVPPLEDVEGRARVLELVSLVICDIQPLQSTRVQSKIRSLGGDEVEIARWTFERGLDVYEDMLGRREAKTYCVGDELTWADVCLVPAAQKALDLGFDIGRWERVKGVVERCWEFEAFRSGGVGGHGRLIP